MCERRFHLGSLGRHFPAFSAVVTLALLTSGVSLLAVPMIRSAEAAESGKERCEDPTLTARYQTEQQFLEYHRGVAAFQQPSGPALGRAQRPVLAVQKGHRLANGLLAPLTC